MFLQLHRCFIMCSLKRFLLRYLMCSVKAITARFLCVLKIFLRMYLKIFWWGIWCALLISFDLSASSYLPKKSSGIVYSEVSVAGRFYHDQVSRLFIADSASRLFFKNFFIADYAGWPFFNHSFHLRSFKIDFLSSNYSKVLFCKGDWMKLKWLKFVNSKYTYPHLVEK